tara:strand:+ start:192 stop:515 length:324 start_codon:yes stop_codon:yes gene_type:complete
MNEEDTPYPCETYCCGNVATKKRESHGGRHRDGYLYKCERCTPGRGEGDGYILLNNPPISIEMILRELILASAPYLKRKKETPRSQCAKLNEVHERARQLIDQHPTN